MSTYQQNLLLLSRELDGELSPEDRETLERELLSCEELRKARASLTGLRAAIRAGESALVPVGFVDRIMSMAQAPHSQNLSEIVEPAPLLRWLKRSACMAAAVLVLCGAIYVFQLPKEAVADQPDPQSTLRFDAEYVRIHKLLQSLDESAGLEREPLPFLDFFAPGSPSGSHR